MQDLRIGEAELEIMKVLWQAGEAIPTAEINRAVEEKGWKRTTISTFLTRLAEKGAVTCEKRGALYYYLPSVTREEYRRAQAGRLVEQLFDGSPAALAASLFENTTLSDADVKELRAIIEGSQR